MTAFLVRRLSFGLVLIVLSTIVSFTILKLSPGETFVSDDPRVSRAYIEQQKRIFGLDQPAWKQYCNWSGLSRLFSRSAPRGILQGSLGTSSLFSQPVSMVLPSRLKATLWLNLMALLLTWAIAVPLGAYAAVRQYRMGDKLVTLFSFIGMSMPGFFLALVMLWLFASRVQWLPPGGLRDPLAHEHMSAAGQVGDYARHLIVPIFVLTFGALAGLQRVTRGNMLEVLGQQYITTARAKGVPETRVVLKHALRNAVNPLVTLLGFEFAGLFGGAALLEIVINYPGMGQLILQALYAKDRDVVMAVFLLGSVTLVLGVLIGDLLRAWVDPRISHG